MTSNRTTWNATGAEMRLPGPLRVAVVDDNETMRDIVVEMLRVLGVSQFLLAADGADFVLRAAGEELNLLIVDGYMQPLGGVELTRLVRRSNTSLPATLPIIFMSGHGEPKLVAAARDAGASEFLAKPFATEILYARIRTLLERPRPFVRTPEFFGPDRRRRSLPWYDVERRRAPDLRQSLDAARATPGAVSRAPNGAYARQS